MQCSTTASKSTSLIFSRSDSGWLLIFMEVSNFIRSQVHSGNKVSQNISQQDFDDEKYLKPVLEDDALLFSLDDLPGVMEDEQRPNGKEASIDSGELVSRVSELEGELRRIQLQFDNYRASVSETLDDRWNEKGMPGTSGAVRIEKEERDDDSHYFSSYSYNGSSPPQWPLLH